MVNSVLEQMANHQNIIGFVIREIREKKGITQAQLVARLNLAGWDLSRGTFSKIEAQIRCVTDFELLKLTEVIGIDPTELLRRGKKQNKC